jgi:hypothetical protein
MGNWANLTDTDEGDVGATCDRSHCPVQPILTPSGSLFFRSDQQRCRKQTGKMTVDQALEASQAEVERAVRRSGYLK